MMLAPGWRRRWRRFLIALALTEQVKPVSERGPGARGLAGGRPKGLFLCRDRTVELPGRCERCCQDVEPARVRTRTQRDGPFCQPHCFNALRRIGIRSDGKCPGQSRQRVRPIRPGLYGAPQVNLSLAAPTCPSQGRTRHELNLGVVRREIERREEVFYGAGKVS